MAHGGNNDRWLLTYSDLITLLLAFFIIIYAMSEMDKKKYTQLAQGLAVALGTMPDGAGTGGSGSGGPLTEDQQFAQVIDELHTYLESQGKSNSVTMNIEERGLVISINANLFFHTGKAELTSESKAILTNVAHALLKIPHNLRVEGHTDNVPISTRDYPSNWQLSTARATNVITFMIEELKFDAQRLSAAGYGEYHPKASNDSAAGRSQNRRVDIVVVRSKYDDIEPNENSPEQ